MERIKSFLEFNYFGSKKPGINCDYELTRMYREKLIGLIT